MPALPESNSHEDDRKSDSAGSTADASLSMLPDVLRGAAYISSGGRVYRLFTESDETTILRSIPAAPFVAEPMFAADPPPAGLDTSLVTSSEDVPPPAELSLAAMEVMEEELELLSNSTPRTSSQAASTVEFSANQTDRRKRAVEGIFAGQLVNQNSARQNPTRRNSTGEIESGASRAVSKTVLFCPSVTSRSARQPTLKLFDVVDEPTSKSTPEPPTIPAPEAEIVVPTPVPVVSDTEEADNTKRSLKLIRLDIRHFRRIQRQYRRPLCPPGKIPSSIPIDTGQEPEWETEQETGREPEVESVAEPEVACTESPLEPNIWHLQWRPTWPDHLASLEHEASSQIQFLADHLEMQLDRGRRVISFNGYRPGDGCTTLALCAARELAERGHRLLLADAHRQHPELALLLELDVDPQHYEIMSLIPDRLELLPWSEAFLEDDLNDGPLTPASRTKSFGEIVAELRSDYDAVLLDNGALIESPLAGRVEQWQRMKSDGVLLVVNTKSYETVDVKSVARRLQQHDIELLGVAENYA